MSDVIDTAGATGQAPAGQPEVKQDAAPVIPETPKADPLAKVIEQARLDRQARAQHEATAKDTQAQLAKARAEVDELRKSQAFEDDPVAYGKARGWDKDKQALIGQILLYDLVPDKAPPDLRVKLFEMRQARKEAEATKAQQESQAKAMEEANRQQLDQYAGYMAESIKTFDFGSMPETEAYYGDDHSSYHKSLIATAMNLANAAKAQGQVADLSPANVAKVLEVEVAKRMSARDQRVAARKPKQVEVPAKKPDAGVKQNPLETATTRNMNGNGTPQPKAMTEAERIQRAIEAGWGNK